MNGSFWRGKRVLLTGHTGFKGGWLALWLQKLGASVVGYALPPPTTPSPFDVASVGDGMESIIGDVCDFDSLYQIMTKYRPEIVFHMAAQPLVRYSYEFPIETYATNVMGTVNLLEAVRRVGCVRVVINITSDKCYENREWVWGYRENEAMGGYDPYSNSKGCAELVSSAFRSSFFNHLDYERHGVALATVRAGNVIGGGDWAKDRLIPDMVTAFSERRSVIIRNPSAIRPWQHVLEPLSGYMMLAEHLWQDGPSFAEGWNFGPKDEDAKPVEWIANYLAKTWGKGACWSLDDVSQSQPHEAHYLKLDCSKAKMRLEWQPRWSLEYALSQIVEWYQLFNADGDMRAFCNQQIDRYSTTGALI